MTVTRQRRSTEPTNGTNGLHSSCAAATNELVRKRVSSLKPSPENSILYSPIGPVDAEILKLAAAIAENGCDALTVTADNYIVSGHRRHAALLFNDQATVSCRVLPLRRDEMTTDAYLALLRSYNHQRHKSVAEQVREELIDIDPEAAHRNLRFLRDKSINAAEYNGIPPLAIEGTKKRSNISDDKADHVKFIKEIVWGLRREYWPLSVRGVHYPLLNYDFVRGYLWPHKGKPGHGTRQELRYRNDDSSYDATADLIARLRLNGEIPWEAFDDGTRPLKEFRPFRDVRQFVRNEIKRLFAGYWRDLLQTQPNHIEVIVEKNTVYHMAQRVTDKYQIPTSSGRGFNSIDPWHDLYERYRASGKERLYLIVLSDFDPEGEMIPQVGGRTLRDDFGVPEHNLVIIKAGVTREQISRHNLPQQNFAKETSSNHKWFVGRNGDDSVYELEALDPKDMLADLESVIQGVVDMDLFNKEAAIEQEEALYLEACRTTAANALKGLGE
jgi:hypothetical protein